MIERFCAQTLQWLRVLEEKGLIISGRKRLVSMGLFLAQETIGQAQDYWDHYKLNVDIIY